ncbi:tyrosine-type recombinase/integrase [Duodenibacillus massiliensis]|uniref:tyrosine-type recombinase/integrase n=1 Tax=Duodenibacillus massiliensis TaxID=1852381 RepID=UPI002FD9AC80
MLTISELTRLSDDLRRQGGETHWIVLDKECALSLRVAGDSAKFYFRTRSPRQVTRSLGGIDEISPMEAKQKVLTLLLALEKGEALPESKTRKAGFAAVDGVHDLPRLMLEWREVQEKLPVPRWKPEDRKARVKFEGLIKNHLKPFIGVPVDKVTAEQLEEHLTMLYRAHASSAKSLLPWVCGTFMWAERKGLLADGYAKVHRLQMLVKEARWRQQGPLRHQPALPVTDLPEFMAELREVGGTTARCLEVAILTVSRVQPIVNMQWDHIDFEKGIWRCPKADMKVQSNGDHVVYLSKQAMQILASMPRYLSGKRKAVWVFSTARGDKICNALTKVISSMNGRRKKRGMPTWVDPEQSRIAGKDRAPTPHGFRATFKSWTRSDKLGNWKRYDNVAVERCMHHYTKDMYGGAYDREDFPEQQRNILQDWADFCYSYRPPLD